MSYTSIPLPSVISVKGIFTVLSPDLSRCNIGKTEAHNFPEIFYLEKGRHRIIIDGVAEELSTGQMVIYAPNSYHSLGGTSESVVSIISFDADGDALIPICNRVITLTTSEERRLSEVIKLASVCFGGLISSGEKTEMTLCEGTDEYKLNRIKLMLEAFLADLVENELHRKEAAESKSARWDAEYRNAITFMRENAHKRMSLAELAEGCDMSVSKLKLLFREKNGEPPVACFLRLKIDEAKRLIKLNNMNFSEISAALGFESIHYFSRLFKKIAGETPSEYKARRV